MGAEMFNQQTVAADVDTAFNMAVEQAQYDYGHAGYTGTIAEKDSYVVVQAEPVSAEEAERLVEAKLDSSEIDDKWGPAGAIRLEDEDGEQRWLFFGWASS